jgi:L-alanine-DL-glutamate epimerase-like enolase superfamily enzyme
MSTWQRFLGRRSRNGPPIDLRLDSGEADTPRLFVASRLPASPVVVERAELLRWRRRFLVRLVSRDGVAGVALAHERLGLVWPMAVERVLPCFVGQDMRRLDAIVDAVGRHPDNYKLTGVAFWSCVAAAEMAALDLLGKTADRSATELLGGEAERPIPVYLSSLRRDTEPQIEAEYLAARLAATGARAVKVKIGGRMGVFDAAPGRTDQLVAAVRRACGDGVELMVDANGSYAAEQATEVGRMLADHGVRYFEEPCPWEDFTATKRVADALDDVQVAGGEQDTSLEKFAWLAANRGVDIVTPDVIACGGMLRTLRVLRLAAAAGLKAGLHSARNDYLACAMLHVASAAPAHDRPHEFLADDPRRESWYAPPFAVRSGMVTMPSGPGLGMAIEPTVLRRARRMG